MPREKDFKRIVRARMAQTGERYTEARSGLRPGAGSGEPLDEPQRLAGVVPDGSRRLPGLAPRPPLPWTR